MHCALLSLSGRMVSYCEEIDVEERDCKRGHRRCNRETYWEHYHECMYVCMHLYMADSLLSSSTMELSCMCLCMHTFFSADQDPHVYDIYITSITDIYLLFRIQRS